MIAENGKVIINKIVLTDSVLSLNKLPDINKNGLSEFVIIATSHSSNLVTDSSQTWLEIIEFSSSDSFNYLGRATTYSWAGRGYKYEGETEIPGWISWAYKIFVKPSTNPIFFRETYRDITDEKTKETKWVLTEKLKEFELEVKKKSQLINRKVL